MSALSNQAQVQRNNNGIQLDFTNARVWAMNSESVMDGDTTITSDVTIGGQKYVIRSVVASGNGISRHQCKNQNNPNSEFESINCAESPGWGEFLFNAITTASPIHAHAG